MDPVEYQYNEHPYPDYPLLAGPSRHNLENIRYSLMAVRAGFRPIDEKHIKILLMGCGTAEPLTFATAHPKSSILAVDLSESSLSRARARLFTRFKFNVEFRKQDLLKTEGHFDLISAYGVIHHLKEPQLGFQKIHELLAPTGIARVMVYSKVSRLRWTQLSQFFKAFGLSAQTPDLQKRVYELIEILPDDHPLKSSFYLNTERKTLSGMIDCFFHAQEHFFLLSELLKNLDQAGLEIFHWQNPTQNLNQLFLNEALDELEGNFIFWVKKKSKEDFNPAIAFNNPPIIETINAPQEIDMYWPSYLLNAQLLKNLPLSLSKDWHFHLRIPHISQNLRREWLRLNLPTDNDFGATALDRESQIKTALQILETITAPSHFYAPSQIPQNTRVTGEDLDLVRTWTTPYPQIREKWAQMPSAAKIQALEALISPLKPFSKVHFHRP